jgi:hypothetical protein
MYALYSMLESWLIHRAHWLQFERHQMLRYLQQACWRLCPFCAMIRGRLFMWFLGGIKQHSMDGWDISNYWAWGLSHSHLLRKNFFGSCFLFNRVHWLSDSLFYYLYHIQCTWLYDFVYIINWLALNMGVSWSILPGNGSIYRKKLIWIGKMMSCRFLKCVRTYNVNLIITVTIRWILLIVL